jgi:Tol biopolymer transport system component
LKFKMVSRRLCFALLAAVLIRSSGLAADGFDSDSGAVTLTDAGTAEETPADEMQPELGEVIDPAEEQPGSSPASLNRETDEDQKPAETIDFAAGFSGIDWLDPLPQPAEIVPLFVRAFTEIAAGHNDSNPIWSPSGDLIAFERSIEDKREIIISRLDDGTVLQKIYHRIPEERSEFDFVFDDVLDDASFNAGISWSPDESRLVFMSNGGSGNYDLYLLPTLGEDKAIRLTNNPEKDSHPHWSPVADYLVFVSGRGGSANIYVMDLASRSVIKLTSGRKTYLYPQWSPDGRKIAMIYGSNENHDIFLIEDINRPIQTLKALTSWNHDDLRPVWSPDGKKIAFYSNYNLENNPRVWSIIVIAADGSDPTAGAGLAEKVVAINVIPDIERGPAWMPDSNRIVYVKNDPKAYNPIYVVQIEERKHQPVNTQTKMNHDLTCSRNGTIAFRAQVEQWDHIYIARLKE